jgi:hypothetical protein
MRRERGVVAKRRGAGETKGRDAKILRPQRRQVARSPSGRAAAACDADNPPPPLPPQAEAAAVGLECSRCCCEGGEGDGAKAAGEHQTVCVTVRAPQCVRRRYARRAPRQRRGEELQPLALQSNGFSNNIIRSCPPEWDAGCRHLRPGGGLPTAEGLHRCCFLRRRLLTPPFDCKFPCQRCRQPQIECAGKQDGVCVWMGGPWMA